MKCNVILTCQLAMALHMKTSELRAPDGFTFTWKRKQIVDIQAQIQLLMQVYKGPTPMVIIMEAIVYHCTKTSECILLFSIITDPAVTSKVLVKNYRHKGLWYQMWSLCRETKNEEYVSVLAISNPRWNYRSPYVKQPFIND